MPEDQETEDRLSHLENELDKLTDVVKAMSDHLMEMSNHLLKVSDTSKVFIAEETGTYVFDEKGFKLKEENKKNEPIYGAYL